jgi:hypothetical protein
MMDNPHSNTRPGGNGGYRHEYIDPNLESHDSSTMAYGPGRNMPGIGSFNATGTGSYSGYGQGGHSQSLHTFDQNHTAPNNGYASIYHSEGDNDNLGNFDTRPTGFSGYGSEIYGQSFDNFDRSNIGSGSTNPGVYNQTGYSHGYDNDNSYQNITGSDFDLNENGFGMYGGGLNTAYSTSSPLRRTVFITLHQMKSDALTFENKQAFQTRVMHMTRMR